MAQMPAIAVLDAHLESLLDMTSTQRAERLDEIGCTEPDLAALLRRLLTMAAGVATADFAPLGITRDLAIDAPPPAIPGYRLLEEIGRGGMAVVYAGVRDVHGSEQQVAIKVLRTALPSPAERERFVNEQRILARLQHPNIAALLDVGIVDGRPYMVIERIDGTPIDAHLQARAADVGATMAAITQLADALQLAHEHFVIHRDIKPGNVLVDRAGRITLIDFGIAKVLGGARGLRADPTLTGANPLTLRYASPEQLLDRPVGVGSDVYQLGLLAYRLLTGAWPHDDPEGELPALRVHADALPVPPSARVAEPRLKRALHGDIDSIVLKCLRFAPAERYRSMAELKDDLARWRERRPVAARRQTRGYLFRRFVQRHRIAFAAGAAATLLVVVVAIAALMLAARSRQFAQRSERTLDAVTQMFTPANPYAPSPKKTTVAEAVDRASDRFLAEDAGDAEFQARLLLRLASMQEASESYARMRALLERADGLARGGDAALRSEIVARELQALFYAGAYDDFAALRARRDAELRGADRVRADHLAASVLAEQGRMAEAQAAVAALLPRLTALDKLTQAQVLNTLGIAQGGAKDYAAELATLQRALALLDPADLAQLPTFIRLRGNIATTLNNLGRSGEAADQYLELLARVRAQLGNAHPMVAKIAANATVMLQHVERFHDAFAASADLDHARVLHDDPAWRAQYLTIVAAAALYDGRFGEVMPRLLDGFETAIDTLDRGSPRLAYFAEQLAWTLWEFGERDLAVTAAAAAFRLSEGQRSTADLLLQLGAEAGTTIAGRPDAAFASRLQSDCDRVHYAALHAKFVAHRDAGTAQVPADCASYERARLEALGLRVDAAQRPAPIQPIRSPLTVRWRDPHDPALGATSLDAETRTRISALIARL
jgi:hypothetical protein